MISMINMNMFNMHLSRCLKNARNIFSFFKFKFMQVNEILIFSHLQHDIPLKCSYLLSTFTCYNYNISNFSCKNLLNTIRPTNFKHACYLFYFFQFFFKLIKTQWKALCFYNVILNDFESMLFYFFQKLNHFSNGLK